MNEGKVEFKKIKRRKIREKSDILFGSEDEEDQGTLVECLEESKELRKLRKKHGGINHERLLAGDKKEKSNKNEDDPYKTKVGGMLDMSALKNVGKVDDAYDTGIGSSFSSETNKRDEDAEMQKFIEKNLAKKKGVQCTEDKVEKEPKYLSPEEAALFAVPEFLRKSFTKKSEEMLGNQMLNGIPEINLGLEAKIRNIEATEEAKQKILRDAASKKNKSSTEEFIPKNVAVNFVQHSRYNITSDDLPSSHSNKQRQQQQQQHKSQENEQKIEPVVGGGVKISTMPPKKDHNSKATDDFYYEKFRSYMRR